MNNLIRKQLSILIPTFNYTCVNLVESLQMQASSLPIEYEIIVADDGSTDKDIININKEISNIPNCKYIVRGKNTGRAVIRNFLAESSKFEWLLFLDCDMDLPDKYFIERYMTTEPTDVIYGGIRIGGDPEKLKNNIRYLYEYASSPQHTATERNKKPYKSFSAANFMISRKAIQANPFNENFRDYGYEDTLFGKQLEKNNIRIRHIDNPLVMTDFEPNDISIAKTEEGLRTLYKFRNELEGSSHLLDLTKKLRYISPFIRLWHKIFGKLERHNLTGKSPSLTLFNIYKLSYYISLTK